jgi:hypothetical protein
VWDVATLGLPHQQPLLTVHDVLKHMQTEDGRLFVWRILEDVVITTACGLCTPNT